MKTSIYSSIKYLFLLALGIMLLLLAFKGQDLNSLLADLKSVNYWWVAASAFACLIAHWLRAKRWCMLIEPLGEGTPSVKNTFYAVMIGYVANLAFPRMGEVSRCGVIHKTDKIPLNQLIGTVITERLIDLFMLFLIIGLAIILQYQLLSTFLYDHVLSHFSGKFNNGSVIIIAISSLIGIPLIVYTIIKKSNWGVAKKMLSLWGGLKNGVLSVKKMRDKNTFIAYSILIWLFYLLSIYLCLFALENLSHLGLIVAFSVLVFGSLGMVAPVQGGIGAFHWIVSEGLTIYSVPRSEGLAYATIIHSSQTIVVLLIGLVSVMMVMINSSKKYKNEQTRSFKG